VDVKIFKNESALFNSEVAIFQWTNTTEYCILRKVTDTIKIIIAEDMPGSWSGVWRKV
jgi:hypothetical protein